MEGDSNTAKNFSGIPAAVFFDNIDEFMNLPENSGDVEKVLRRLDQLYGKYRFMECTLDAKRVRLLRQIPDLERSMEMIETFKSQKQETEVNFLMSDQVLMKASIKPRKTVYLWLGANIMLEYTLEDAEKLLTTNINKAKSNLSCIEHDLDFVCDQRTTTEVNISRIHNWDVKRRRAKATSS